VVFELWKGLPIVGALLIAQMQPPPAPSEGAFLQYAITQGGLLSFSLVLLYIWRSDNKRREATDAATIGVLSALINESKTALVTATVTIEAQSQSIRDMAAIVARIEERRTSR